MAERLTTDNIVDVLSEVEHPEIASSLLKLGMLKDINYDESTAEVSLVLSLPTLGIPEAVRRILVSSIEGALSDAGAIAKIEVVEMTDGERMHFMSMAQEHWRPELR